MKFLKMVVLGRGGLNFDAKVRRTSFEAEDLFRAHIAGMDSFAIGLKVAQRLVDDEVLDDIIAKRYMSFKDGIGKTIVDGKADFHLLEEYALSLEEIKHQSGLTEQIQAMINQYLLTTNFK